MVGIWFPLWLVLFECMIYSANDLLLPALPVIQDTFHFPDEAKGLTMIAWLMGASCFHIVLAPVVEKKGYRFFWFIGMAIFALGLILAIVSQNIEVFLFSRVLQGLAMSSVLVAGYAWFHEYYNTKEAVGHLAWMSAIRLIPPILGSFVGVWFLQYSDWRTIFMVLLFLVLIFGSLCSQYMPKKTKKNTVVGGFRVYLQLIKVPKLMLSNAVLSMITTMVFAWLTHASWIILRVENLSGYVFSQMQCAVFSGFLLGSLFLHRFHARYTLERWAFFGLLWVTGWMICLCFLDVFDTHASWGHVVCIGNIFVGLSIVRNVVQRLVMESVEGHAAKKMALMAAMTRFCAMTMLLVFANAKISWHWLSSVFAVALLVLWVVVWIYRKHCYRKSAVVLAINP